MATGRQVHTSVNLCRLGNSVESGHVLVRNSFSCPGKFSCCRYVFHSVLRSKETIAYLQNSDPCNDLAGIALPMIYESLN